MKKAFNTKTKALVLGNWTATEEESDHNPLQMQTDK